MAGTASAESERRYGAHTAGQRVQTPLAEQHVRLVCDRTPVSIDWRRGRWVVADESALRAEVDMLGRLGDNSMSVDRALAVCGALNACLIYPDEAHSLNRRLAGLERRSPQRFRFTGYEDVIALTQACAWLSTEGAWRWLLWILQRRLEPSMLQTPWRGPGWRHLDRPWLFETDVAPWLDDEFWDRMASHPDERFRQLAIASDPRADPERLEGLGCSLHSEIRELVAANPSTPLDFISRLAQEEHWSAAGRWLPLPQLRALEHPMLPAEDIEQVVLRWLDPASSCETARDAASLYEVVLRAVSHPNVSSRTLSRVERRYVGGSGVNREHIRQMIAEHRRQRPGEWWGLG